MGSRRGAELSAPTACSSTYFARPTASPLTRSRRSRRGPITWGSSIRTDSVHPRPSHADPGERSSQLPGQPGFGRIRSTRSGRTEYFTPMLKAKVPNLEMQIYGRGTHGGSISPRDGTPLRDVAGPYIRMVPRPRVPGEAGVETKAAKESAESQETYEVDATFRSSEGQGMQPLGFLLFMEWVCLQAPQPCQAAGLGPLHDRLKLRIVVVELDDTLPFSRGLGFFRPSGIVIRGFQLGRDEGDSIRFRTDPFLISSAR